MASHDQLPRSLKDHPAGGILMFRIMDTEDARDHDGIDLSHQRIDGIF